jgi:hypothetical protein
MDEVYELSEGRPKKNFRKVGLEKVDWHASCHSQHFESRRGGEILVLLNLQYIAFVCRVKHKCVGITFPLDISYDKGPHAFPWILQKVSLEMWTGYGTFHSQHFSAGRRRFEGMLQAKTTKASSRSAPSARSPDSWGLGAMDRVLFRPSGWLAPRSGFSYAPALAIAGSLHIVAFVVLLTMVRSLQYGRDFGIPSPFSIIHFVEVHWFCRYGTDDNHFSSIEIWAGQSHGGRLRHSDLNWAIGRVR